MRPYERPCKHSHKSSAFSPTRSAHHYLLKREITPRYRSKLAIRKYQVYLFVRVLMGTSSDSPSNVMHLLSHIYVARSEALWKEASNVSWFVTQVTAVLPTIDSSSAKSLRSDALAMMKMTRDPLDETINVPLFICRHVLCSESTSWLGFLPREISSRPFHAYDPLPPTTAVTLYDDQYFNGVRTSARSSTAMGGLNTLLERLVHTVEQDRTDGRDRINWQDRINRMMNVIRGLRELALPEGEMAGLMGNVSRPAFHFFALSCVGLTFRSS